MYVFCELTPLSRVFARNGGTEAIHRGEVLLGDKQGASRTEHTSSLAQQKREVSHLFAGQSQTAGCEGAPAHARG